MNGCDEVIQNSWNVQVEGSRMFQFHKNIKQCRKGLLEWRKKESTDPRIQIECIKREMESLQNMGGQGEREKWHSLSARSSIQS